MIGPLGIVFNVSKFLVDNDGDAQIQVGFNLAHGIAILHQSTWGFIEEVVVLRPSMVGQFAFGWHGHKPIARSS